MNRISGQINCYAFIKNEINVLIKCIIKYVKSFFEIITNCIHHSTDRSTFNPTQLIIEEPIQLIEEPIQQIENPIQPTAHYSQEQINNAVKVIQKKIREKLNDFKKNQFKINSNGLFDQWSSKHIKNFIAHAIWEDNVGSVFKDGRVIPAEARFRKGCNVSYEKGYTRGVRGTSVMPELMENEIDFLKNYKKQYKLISYIDDKGKFILGTQRCKGNRLEDFEKLLIKNGRNKNEIYEYMDVSSLLIDMYADREERIDYVLSKFWNDNKEYYNSLDNIIKSPRGANLTKKEKFLHKFYSIKFKNVHIDKLNDNIRVLYNEIHWGYGSVVVLRGNGLDIIDHKKPPVVGEAQLLFPWQNGGEPFCLNLDNEDTIILGPKKELEEHCKNTNLKNIVFIEDLTPSQRRLLRVPIQLDKEFFIKLIKSCDKEIATNKLNSFKRYFGNEEICNNDNFSEKFLQEINYSTQNNDNKQQIQLK